MAHHEPSSAGDCPTWRALDRDARDYILADFMEWAWATYTVELKMLARGDHVAICELVTIRPGEGRVRKVMEELCRWADCSGIPLELTPSDHWGADVERLIRFYTSLGFQLNHEPRSLYRLQEHMIRYPAHT